MTGTVQDVRDENYKEFTESAGAVVAYGLATCEPCKQYDPILEETAARFPTIKIGKAKLTPLGKIEPAKSWARAKDHRKAARLEKKWRATGKVRGK